MECADMERRRRRLGREQTEQLRDRGVHKRLFAQTRFPGLGSRHFCLYFKGSRLRDEPTGSDFLLGRSASDMLVAYLTVFCKPDLAFVRLRSCHSRTDHESEPAASVSADSLHEIWRPRRNLHRKHKGQIFQCLRWRGGYSC